MELDHCPPPPPKPLEILSIKELLSPALTGERVEDNDRARLTKSLLKKPLPVRVILAALKCPPPPFNGATGIILPTKVFRRRERRKGNHNKGIVAVGGGAAACSFYGGAD